jgi:DNA-binding MarR family transcriptional regulator
MNDETCRTSTVLLTLLQHSRVSFERLAERYSLTFPQLMLLYQLYKANSLMGTVAKKMHCDASNITGIVDRLESQGYIERVALPKDRRAKELHITEQGTELIEKILADMPSQLNITSLSSFEQEELRTIVHKLTLSTS